MAPAIFVLALAGIGLPAADPATVRSAYLAMEPAARLVLVLLAILSALSGLLQSLGTPWGLFRHYWVLFKLLITLVATGMHPKLCAGRNSPQPVDWTRGSAIRRAGYAGLKRNVAVAMGNWLPSVAEPPEEAVAVLRDAIEHDEALVVEHAAWALEQAR